MSDTRGAEPAGIGGNGDDQLEMWVGSTRTLIPLERGGITIGLSPTNDVPLAFDRTVSRVHAVLELIASRWCVRDLASRNGTVVNAERIWTERPLRNGDEIRVGSVRLVARIEAPDADANETVGAEVGPSLTRREREVLVAL